MCIWLYAVFQLDTLVEVISSKTDLLPWVCELVYAVFQLEMCKSLVLAFFCNSFHKSVWLLSVPVIYPHSALPDPPLPLVTDTVPSSVMLNPSPILIQPKASEEAIGNLISAVLVW